MTCAAVGYFRVPSFRWERTRSQPKSRGHETPRASTTQEREAVCQDRYAYRFPETGWRRFGDEREGEKGG
jgi:hypothetical protein